MVVCGAVSQLLPGERRDLNGELMQSGERGNPDHSPDQQHGQAGKPQGALMGVGNGRMQEANGCL